MEQRLPPADILEVPGRSGYLVMRRRKAERSPAASSGAPYQRPPRRLPAARPESQRPLEVAAPDAAAPHEPAVWTAEDEKRYQGQLEHLQLLVRLGHVLEQRLAEERAAAGIGADPGTATSTAASPPARMAPLRPQRLSFDAASPAAAQGKRQAGPAPSSGLARASPMSATWTKETFGAFSCEASSAAAACLHCTASLQCCCGLCQPSCPTPDRRRAHGRCPSARLMQPLPACCCGLPADTYTLA
jgi:hypothetical protein